MEYVFQMSHCLRNAQSSKDQPVCYGTSQLKNGFCVNSWYALLKTLVLKRNKQGSAINNLSVLCGDTEPPLIAKP